jgi:hypothetical protein
VQLNFILFFLPLLMDGKANGGEQRHDGLMQSLCVGDGHALFLSLSLYLVFFIIDMMT